MKTFLIPEFGITVQVVPGGSRSTASISSELKEHMFGKDEPGPNDFEILGAIDAIESMVLAHACAGIDVASPAYVEGLRCSLEAITNHYA
jgi:hypothetical protein